MAKRKIVWSSGAKLDLFKILDFYIKRNGTATYSRKLNSTIRGTLKLLVKTPDIGVQTDVQNVRNLPEGDYSIFYEIKPDRIEIITIWDNRQNPENLSTSR
jgi:plasmid stabilization system protein ParE